MIPIECKHCHAIITISTKKNCPLCKQPLQEQAKKEKKHEKKQ